MFEGHYTSSKWSLSPTWPKGMEICCGQMKEDWWRKISSRSLNILYPQTLYEIWALLGKVERKYAWTMILHWEVSDLELWYKKLVQGHYKPFTHKHCMGEVWALLVEEKEKYLLHGKNEIRGRQTDRLIRITHLELMYSTIQCYRYDGDEHLKIGSSL